MSYPGTTKVTSVLVITKEHAELYYAYQRILKVPNRNKGKKIKDTMEILNTSISILPHCSLHLKKSSENFLGQKSQGLCNTNPNLYIVIKDLWFKHYGFKALG